MAEHQTEKIIINGRLNTRAHWYALGREQNFQLQNYEPQDDGSVKVRPHWYFPRRPNLLTVNQADIETDTTGWAAAVNCTIARDTTIFASGGLASLRLTATGAGTMSATTPTGVSGRAVTANMQYSAYALFQAGTTGRVVNLYLRWYNSGGTFLSEAVSQSADTTGVFSSVAVLGAVAPSTAAFAAIAVEIVSAGAAEQHFVDHIQLNFGAENVQWNRPQAGTPKGGTNVFWSTLDDSVYVSRRDDGGNQMTIHKADDESSPDWGTAAIDTISGANWMCPFVVGNGIVLYGNFTFPNSRLRFWNGTTAAEASTVGVAGRALAYYKERFWSAGPDAQPSRLYYSGITDHTSWDLNNYVPVGPDDGGVIEDIAPALGGLLIAKQNGIWFLSGDGPTNFVLTKLDGGEGNWGRCICATPYGAVIAGTIAVYLWQGGAVEPITTELVSYTPGGSWVTTAYRDDKVFITTNGQMFVRDMAAEKWMVWSSASGQNTPSAITVGGTDLSTLICVAQSNCIEALAGIQNMNAVSSFRTKDVHNQGEGWSLTTGFFPLAPLGRPFTIDRMTVLLKQNLDAGPGAPDINLGAYRPTDTGTGGTTVANKIVTPEPFSGLYRYQMEGSRRPQHLFAFSAIQSIFANELDEVIWDILDVEVEYHIEEPR